MSRDKSRGLIVEFGRFEDDPLIWRDTFSLVPAEHDYRNDSIKFVDFSRVEFVTCFKRAKKPITGKEVLTRLRAGNQILLGANACQGLWDDHLTKKGTAKSILEALFRLNGITCLGFFGDLLIGGPTGDSHNVLVLCRESDGWFRYCRWLILPWPAMYVPVVLPLDRAYEKKSPQTKRSLG